MVILNLEQQSLFKVRKYEVILNDWVSQVVFQIEIKFKFCLITFRFYSFDSYTPPPGYMWYVAVAICITNSDPACTNLTYFIFIHHRDTSAGQKVVVYFTELQTLTCMFT